MASPVSPRAAALALGFGTAVAMWAIGFVARLSPDAVPSPVLGIALLLCLVAGGARAGRLPGLGAGTGAGVGAVASLVNLLILGSVIGGEGAGGLVPSAAIWGPGSILFGAAAGALGAILAGRGAAHADHPDWTAVLARVAVVATICLVAIGGLVTSHEAGLAVVDWPNSYGTNMFLYPLSRMVGGIYYEHAHRLFGALVGLTTLVFWIRLLATEPRRWVKGFGGAALLLVIVQGILGGLRVTGHFTLSDDPTVTRPSLMLAMVHGFTGQVFLASLAALAAVTSRLWTTEIAGAERPAVPAPRAARDRRLAWITVGAILLQLVLGLRLRHTGGGMWEHVGWALVVIGHITAVGVRGMLDTGRARPARTSAAVLLGTGWLQVVLGMAALTAIMIRGEVGDPPAYEVAFATLHQTLGAIVLGAAVVHALAVRRFPSRGTAPADAPAAESGAAA